MAEHLTVSTSDRGFDRLPPIESTYPNTNVRVYESSAAEEPCIWLAVEGPVDLSRPFGAKHSVPVHLTVTAAVQLAEQIRHLVANHYQGSADG